MNVSIHPETEVVATRLGLGNLGPEAAIPVMEGKAVLFKELADIDAFPICLKSQDPDIIVQTVEQIAPVFGAINLEDIAAPRCFDIEQRLIDRLDIPVMHDDQHGTAVVVLAAANGLTSVIPIADLSEEYIVPSVFNRDVVPTIARFVAQAARDAGIARRESAD